MAHRLNLVKTRIISSREELDLFKREASAALLKFAESNDVDLEAVSKTLSAKYAEMSKAIDDGFKVESEVDLHPQTPTPPGVTKDAAPVTPVIMGRPAGYFDPEQISLLSQTMFQKDFDALTEPEIAEVMVAMRAQYSSLESTGMNRNACMQKPVIAAHEAYDEANPPEEQEAAEHQPLQPAPESQDPLDLMTAEDVQITAEDISKLLAAAPEKQKLAAGIVTASAQIGSRQAWQILTRLTADHYSKDELAQLRAALRVLAAKEDEAEPEAEEDEVPTKEKESAVGIAEQTFSEPGELKAASDLVDQFNQLMEDIDPDGELFSPVSVDEIARRVTETTSRESKDADLVQEAPASTGEYDALLPKFQALPKEEKAAVTEGVDAADIPEAVDQWYATLGLNVLDDMKAGIAAYLATNKIEDVTADQIMAVWEASGDTGHITPQKLNQSRADISNPPPAPKTPEEQSSPEFKPGPLSEEFSKQHKEQLANRPPTVPDVGEVYDTTTGKGVIVTTPTIVPVEPGEVEERYGEEHAGNYSVKVVDPNGKILGWYPTVAEAKMDYADALVKG